MPEKFLFQLRNSTDPNCVITSRWWGKSCSCSCRGPLPAALPGTAHPLPLRRGWSQLRTQPAGWDGDRSPPSQQHQDDGSGGRAAAALRHLRKPQREEEPARLVLASWREPGPTTDACPPTALLHRPDPTQSGLPIPNVYFFSLLNVFSRC